MIKQSCSNSAGLFYLEFSTKTQQFRVFAHANELYPQMLKHLAVYNLKDGKNELVRSYHIFHKIHGIVKSNDKMVSFDLTSSFK